MKDIMRIREQFIKEVSGEALFKGMAEGNPGALNAVMEILTLPGEEGPKLLAHLADMNIRGQQLAYVYQEICQRDLLILAAKVNARDPEMVNAVNTFFRCDIPYKAVTHGALEAEKPPTFE
jgi:hypothetical protein